MGECVWTRLPDDPHPFFLMGRVKYATSCTDKIAMGPYPIYPDDCPNCEQPVRIATHASGGNR